MTEEEAKQFGAEHNMFTVETSAKTGSNVELAFSAITQEVSVEKYQLLLLSEVCLEILYRVWHIFFIILGRRVKKC